MKKLLFGALVACLLVGCSAESETPKAEEPVATEVVVEPPSAEEIVEEEPEANSESEDAVPDIPADLTDAEWKLIVRAIGIGTDYKEEDIVKVERSGFGLNPDDIEDETIKKGAEIMQNDMLHYDVTTKDGFTWPIDISKHLLDD